VLYYNLLRDVFARPCPTIFGRFLGSCHCLNEFIHVYLFVSLAEITNTQSVATSKKPFNKKHNNRSKTVNLTGLKHSTLSVIEGVQTLRAEHRAEPTGDWAYVGVRCC
jgi:hypothetical protein